MTLSHYITLDNVLNCIGQSVAINRLERDAWYNALNCTRPNSTTSFERMKWRVYDFIGKYIIPDNYIKLPFNQ